MKRDPLKQYVSLRQSLLKRKAALETELRENAEARTFFAKDLPFEIQVTGYQRNANIVQAEEGEKTAIDGYRIQPVKNAKEDEANVSAVEITVKPKDGAEQKAILWERAQEPFTVKVGDISYAISLSRMKWKDRKSTRLNSSH